MKKNPPRSRTKRPTVTLDLKAKEVKKDSPKNQSGKSTASGSTQNKSASSPPGSDKSDKNARPNKGKSDIRQSSSGKPDAKQSRPAGNAGGPKTPTGGSAKTRPAAKPAKGGGGFFSHLVSSLMGAVLGIFGLTYANNQNLLPDGLQLSGSEGVTEQVRSLEGKLNTLRSKTVSSDINSMSNRLAHLKARLDKTQAGLSGGPQGGASLAQKVAGLETVMANLEQAAKTGKGGKLAGLTAVTKQLANANKRSLTLKTELIKVREEQSAFREDLTNIRSAQADFTSSNAKVSNELAKLKNSNAKIAATASRPPDVSAQINPVIATLGKLTSKIDGVMNREANSKAEGRNIALALSLGELKRAVNEGVPYRAELARVAPHAPKGLDLSGLSQYAGKGLVTRAKLRSTFSLLAQKALASEHEVTSGSFVDQILSSAKNMVQVRPTGPVKGDTTGAVLSRMEYNLGRNDLARSLSESASLSEQAKKVMQPWLDDASSRLGGNTLLRTLEDKIRNALAGSVSQ